MGTQKNANRLTGRTDRNYRVEVDILKQKGMVAIQRVGNLVKKYMEIQTNTSRPTSRTDRNARIEIDILKEIRMVAMQRLDNLLKLIYGNTQ